MQSKRKGTRGCVRASALLLGMLAPLARAQISDDVDKVMAQMKAKPINDMFATGGTIRPDGRMVHEMYLLQVKTPAESKYPWDYYKVVAAVPGDQAFASKAESKCSLWK